VVADFQNVPLDSPGNAVVPEETLLHKDIADVDVTPAADSVTEQSDRISAIAALGRQAVGLSEVAPFEDDTKTWVGENHDAAYGVDTRLQLQKGARDALTLDPPAPPALPCKEKATPGPVVVVASAKGPKETPAKQTPAKQASLKNVYFKKSGQWGFKKEHLWHAFKKGYEDAKDKPQEQKTGTAEAVKKTTPSTTTGIPSGYAGNKDQQEKQRDVENEIADRAGTMGFVGNGCCRFDGWESTSKGYMSIQKCVSSCGLDDFCVAADVSSPTSPDKYKCTWYKGKTPEQDITFFHSIRTACWNPAQVMDNQCYEFVHPTYVTPDGQ